MLSGCTVDLLQPDGPIGEGNRDMMVLEFAIMMCVVVPTCIATLFFAWKYRASNTKAEYRPNWSHSNAVEVFIWGMPIAIIAVLSGFNYWSTHYYDPYRSLPKDMLVREHAENTKPLTIEVVAIDWKWLFIYPEQGIATINELDVPTKTPLNLHITSDSVMTSFFIPQLGSQIYSMAGMETQLHLLARNPGVLRGEAAQYSGPGFSDMKFKTIALPQEQFQSWVENVRNGSSQFASHEPLNLQTYPKYAKPPVVRESVAPTPSPVIYFGEAQSDLFQHIIAKYNNGMVRSINNGKIMRMDMHAASNGAASSSDTGM
ncbi:ubiquinol oxidase subunit II [Saccharibacter sp. 17.LH.SD]|nr:ubiquinol oxidase subunit II [Saccharibacter sp. 17.LH.SD]